MAVTNVVVDSRVLGPSDGEPRQASISDDQWQVLKGRAATSGSWMWTYRSERLDDVGEGRLVGAGALLAIDLILAAVATILFFYRPI